MCAPQPAGPPAGSSLAMPSVASPGVMSVADPYSVGVVFVGHVQC